MARASHDRPAVLANPHAERVRRVRGLAGRSRRIRTGLLLVEGPQAVRELLAFRPGEVRDVYLSEAAAAHHPDIARAAAAATRFVHPVTDEVAAALSAQAQGVVAVAGRGAIRAPAAPAERPLVVLLPRSQDPGNVGTIVRTADAMGASAVLLGEGSAEAGSPKVIRSSAGSVFHLPIAQGVDFEDAAGGLRAEGARVLGAAGEGDVDLADLLEDGRVLRGPHAWAFGNEAHGLSAAERAACDALVRIPMPGHAESLNVAQAAAMCLFASALARSRPHGAGRAGTGAEPNRSRESA